MIVIELGEVNVRHQLGLHMINRVVKRLYKLVKVLLVKQDLVLFISKPVFLKPLFTFCDGEVVIVRTGRFYIKEIGSLASLHFRRENFVPAICLVVFHNPSGFLVRSWFGHFEDTILTFECKTYVLIISKCNLCLTTEVVKFPLESALFTPLGIACEVGYQPDQTRI